jgi:hypothetical protein
MMNLERQKRAISKEFSKRAKASIAVAVGVPVAAIGIGVGLGETHNLPEEAQAVYDNIRAKGIEIIKEKLGKEGPKITVEVPGEPIIISPPVETPPPVVEETPAPQEYEGVVIPAIKGLRFEAGTFFAEAGNSYGLEEGERAGVFVKEAVEINEKMEPGIGLKPEVIEVIQKKIIEEDKEFRYPLPFDFEQAKGIKIKEVPDTRDDEWAKKDGVFWDDNFEMVVSNVPLGTIIYSPMSTSSEGYLFLKNYQNTRDDYYILTFLINPSLRGKLFRGDERIDVGAVGIYAIGIILLPEGIEKKMVYEEGPLPFYQSDVKMGTPVAEIISKEYLDDQYWDKDILPLEPTSEPSISIYYSISQLKDPDKPFTNVDQLSKYLTTGLENLLRLGEEMFVFISPAYD